MSLEVEPVMGQGVIRCEGMWRCSGSLVLTGTFPLLFSFSTQTNMRGLIEAMPTITNPNLYFSGLFLFKEIRWGGGLLDMFATAFNIKIVALVYGKYSIILV